MATAARGWTRKVMGFFGKRVGPEEGDTKVMVMALAPGQLLFGTDAVSLARH